MSYRRRSYKGSAGTRFVRQRYQYFVDMQTKDTTMQVIKITAGGRMPQIRLRPFFGAFKYFKLNTVKVRFVPCATLPVDPTGLSYEAGEQTIDPRDQMNPGLVRITNGEDVGDLTDILTGVDAERAYYTTMLDPRWYKFQLQSGFKRSAKPLVWNVGQTAQSASQSVVSDYAAGQPPTPIPSSDDKAEAIVSHLVDASGVTTHQRMYPTADNTYPPYIVNPLDAVLMQTGRIKMGWMPTDMFNSGVYGPAPVPEVDLITCILPKAYKTSYFYRCYIEEEVLFKEPVSITPLVSTFTGEGESMTSLQYLNNVAVDRFVLPLENYPVFGNNPSSSSASTITTNNKLNGGKI